jgi:PhnB protein
MARETGRRTQCTAAFAAAEIRAVVESRAQAIRSKHADGVLAHNAPDISCFDLIAPLHRRDAPAARRQLEHWFAAYEGPLGCEIAEFDAFVVDDTAFCRFLQRFTGTNTAGAAVDLRVRVTLGLRRRAGRWLIVHERMSEPLDVWNQPADAAA